MKTNIQKVYCKNVAQTKTISDRASCKQTPKLQHTLGPLQTNTNHKNLDWSAVSSFLVFFNYFLMLVKIVETECLFVHGKVSVSLSRSMFILSANKQTCLLEVMVDKIHCLCVLPKYILKFSWSEYEPSPGWVGQIGMLESYFLVLNSQLLLLDLCWNAARKHCQWKHKGGNLALKRLPLWKIPIWFI